MAAGKKLAAVPKDHRNGYCQSGRSRGRLLGCEALSEREVQQQIFAVDRGDRRSETPSSSAAAKSGNPCRSPATNAALVARLTWDNTSYPTARVAHVSTSPANKVDMRVMDCLASNFADVDANVKTFDCLADVEDFLA
jgi:hypothetical protein